MCYSFYYLHIVWGVSLASGGTHKNNQRLWDQVGLFDDRKTHTHTHMRAQCLYVIVRADTHNCMEPTSVPPPICCTHHVVVVQRHHLNLQPPSLGLSHNPLGGVLGSSSLAPVQDEQTGLWHYDWLKHKVTKHCANLEGQHINITLVTLTVIFSHHCWVFFACGLFIL